MQHALTARKCLPAPDFEEQAVLRSTRNSSVLNENKENSMSQRLDWRGSCRAIAIAATILLCFVFTIAAAAQDGSTRGNSASADSGVPLASADNTPVSSTSMFVPESSVVRSED